MKLSLLGQLAQLMLGLGLGAALGLAFDVLRVPRRHVRSTVLRTLLDGVFCLLTLGAVFLLGMTAGDGQVRLFLFAAIVLRSLAQRAHFPAAGAIWPPVRAKNAPDHGSGKKIHKKSSVFCKKTLPISPQMF